MAHACIEVPMPVLGYCLMPNHFHLVVQPASAKELSRWMHWLQNTHVRRYHQHYKGSGHIWQGRDKSFPIQSFNRGAPFGSEPWVEAAVRKDGLESTIRRRGRPPKERAEPTET